MINIIIAYDNQDANLGIYHTECKNDIINLISEHIPFLNLTSEISSPQCNVAYIDINIPTLKPQPFIFIAYTHGKKDGLVCNGNSYVATTNSHHFENSLFYSTACLIGKELGPDLIDKRCKAFIGFKEESEVFANEEYRNTFINCDNYAIKMLLTSNATVGEAFNSMKNHHTSIIDHLLEIGENPLYIGALTANRDALICLGNKDLKKEDLFCLV